MKPGARPPPGGRTERASMPRRDSTQAITAFEFHISPAGAERQSVEVDRRHLPFGSF